MKTAKIVLLIILGIILCIQVGMNFYLFFNKVSLLEKFLSNTQVKIKGLYYIFPNILFIKNFSLSNTQTNLELKNSLLFFNITKLLKNKFELDSLQTISSNLNILNLKLLMRQEDHEKKIQLEDILKSLPKKIKLKNLVIVYNNEIITLNNFKGYSKKNKINFLGNGVYKNFSFDIEINADMFNKKWDGVLKTHLLEENIKFLKILTNPSFLLKVNGGFEFSRPQNFILEFSANKQIYKSTGQFRFSPFEISGTFVDNSNITGNFYISVEDNKSTLNYEGVINIGDIINQDILKTKLNNLETKIYITKDNSGYKFLLDAFNKDFKINTNLKNNTGDFVLVFWKNYINGKIYYDKYNKKLKIIDRNKTEQFNLSFYFSEENTLKIDGVVLKYRTLFNGKFKDNPEFKAEVCSDKFNFALNYSTANIFAKYNNFSTSSELTLNILPIDNTFSSFNFDIKSKNLKIKNNFSFIINGSIIKKDYKSNKYELNAEINNLFIDNIKLFDNAKLSGDFEKNILTFNMISKDSSIIAKGSWNTLQNAFTTNMSIQRKNFILNEINMDIYSKIKLSKTKNWNIVGNYNLMNLMYNKTLLAETVSGDVKTISLRTIFKGKISYNRNQYEYEIILPNKEKYGLLKLTNISFLSVSNNTVDKYIAELKFNTDFLKTSELLASGKIYNENSEVSISLFNYLLNEGIIKIKSKFKNFNISSNYIIGDSDINIQKKNEIIVSSITLTNFWINNYPIEKLYIQFLYNTVNKSFNFVPLTLEHKNFTTTSGVLTLVGNSIKFDRFKIFNNLNQSIFLDGEIGSHNDLLNIKVNKIPLQIFSSLLNLNEIDANGLVDAILRVNTFSQYKKVNKYIFSANFLISNVSFYNLKINHISGKINNFENYLNLEKTEIVFDKNQKISIKGKYNTQDKSLNFVVNSYNCDLSILNNFYNLVDKAQGELVLNLNIQGKLNSPKLYGYFYVSKGKINFKKYIKYIENLSCRVRFLGENANIEKFIGYYDKTKLMLNGSYNIKNNYMFQLKTEGGSGVLVSIPELSLPLDSFFKFVKSDSSYGNLHFDLTLTKQKAGLPFLYGTIMMNNTYFTYPGTYKYKGSTSNLFYDITLVANENVWYKNELILANITGKINFKYIQNMDKSTVNGEIQALRGNINFLNTSLDIKSGTLEIINKEVYLELAAETDIVTAEKEKIKVQLIVPRAKISDIKPKLTSPTYPELKTEDITALMIGVGNLQKEGNKVNVVASEKIDSLSLLKAQIVKIISTTIATPIAKNILKKWNIADNITITQTDADFVSDKISEENNTSKQNTVSSIDIFKNTKYGIEKYITPDMIIGYSIALAEYNNKLNLKHEIEISYRLKNNIFIKGIYDYGMRDYNTGRYGSDVRIQIQPQFKFKSWAEEKEENK